ncbi:protein DEHYDRATION-INDUCED 19 homolog 4-like [Cucumis melo]|uniref:Protein DEHYDRATION-INDUCED 19 homolog 4-like n=1 Tax=Cucumis melo TaxID=3656 RepID=A0ABM3L0D6_CUCME|nr:protein DEHYDRATION-INDUCED 19 homolog 4-like [Cucumis melo]
MDSEAYTYGLSDAAAARSSKSQSHFYFDYEEVDGDDDLNSEYPCPFCPEEFDLVELCCHIDDEHPVEANFGICPICSTSVGENMVGHITMQHGDVFNSQQRLKFHKDDFPQSLSFERKELQDDHVRILSGFSSLHSTSKMAPDPLLSFLCNAPVINESKTVQPEPSSKEKMEEKVVDDTLSERDVQLSSIPDTNQEEKTRRCDFIRDLVFSVMLGDDL